MTGHKWFMSAPMCDAFLILAQTPAGLSCLFLPRVLPDGSINTIHIQRLKDKLGNKANVQLRGRVCDAMGPGWSVKRVAACRPLSTMGSKTRLDCALGTSGLMRQSLSIALHHTAQRKAFGKPLIAQPLMRNVLADLALESEAACDAGLRLARAFDRADDALGKRLPPGADARCQVLDLQTWEPLRRRRRWSAWAATATWRRAAKA